MYSFTNSIRKYFHKEPIIVGPGIKTGGGKYITIFRYDQTLLMLLVPTIVTIVLV